MQIALVYHPQMAAARLDRVAALAQVLAARGHDVSHHNSRTFQAAADAPAADLVCICGGDGTAQLVIAEQPDSAALPALAIYPTGTINLLARELDYPADPRRFAARIEQGREPLPVSLATVNGRTFLCCLSVGADAHAVAALSEPLKARITLATEADGNVLGVFNTNERTGRYIVLVQPEKRYVITVESLGFEARKLPLSTVGVAFDAHEIPLDITLTRNESTARNTDGPITAPKH